MQDEPVTTLTRLGPVEYVDWGQGPVVLIVHGSPGGYDHAVAMSRFLVEAGFRALAVARPGYQGTPLTDETSSFDQQAQVLVALLDALDIEKVGLFAWSGGGPVAYRFAVGFRERTNALVVFAGISHALPCDTPLVNKLVSRTVVGNALMNAVVDYAPEVIVSGTLASVGELSKERSRQQVAEIMADPQKLDFVLAVARAASERGDRKLGTENDYAAFETFASLDLDSITTPTLLVHGTVDTEVPIGHSHLAADQIEDSELLLLEQGTHLALYIHEDSREAQAYVVDFFRAHATSTIS